MKAEDFGDPLTPGDIDEIVDCQEIDTPLQPTPDTAPVRSNLRCFAELVALVLLAGGFLVLGFSFGATH